MKANKNTYYIVNDTITGSLSRGQELATKHKVDTYTDYNEYIADCEKLNIEAVEKLEDEKPVSVIRAAQGKAQLAKLGLYNNVADMIEQSDNIILDIFWTTDSHWNKNSPTIQNFAKQLDIDLEQFFKDAKEIVI